MDGVLKSGRGIAGKGSGGAGVDPGDRLGGGVEVGSVTPATSAFKLFQKSLALRLRHLAMIEQQIKDAKEVYSNASTQAGGWGGRE